MKYFVWLPGLRGPEAQLWDDAVKTREGKLIKPLFGVEVSDNATLEECVALYPFEAKP